jgi:hypothetical protein
MKVRGFLTECSYKSNHSTISLRIELSIDLRGGFMTIYAKLTSGGAVSGLMPGVAIVIGRRK